MPFTYVDVLLLNYLEGIIQAEENFEKQYYKRRESKKEKHKKKDKN